MKKGLHSCSAPQMSHDYAILKISLFFHPYISTNFPALTSPLEALQPSKHLHQWTCREELHQLVYTRTWRSSSNIFFQGELEPFSSFHGARRRVHWASHKFVIGLTQRRRQPFMQPNENSQLPKMLLFKLQEEVRTPRENPCRAISSTTPLW